ncbi:MAG TPA: heavy metal translocating P-type ATPase metal-binding domain-containing protein [Thermoanaerobaculia bacterium]|nr:heavy metal translocating P-type ATPase metal-binding domain-containing protein [Thermoanaerobaculia bacterium]
MSAPTPPAGETPCRHCGTPTPCDAANAPFCCAGCAAVHALLVEGGLTRYYELAGDRVTPAPAAAAGRDLDWLEPLLPEAADGELAALSLDVQGIHCSACVWLFQELFRRRPGGAEITVNPALGQVRLVWSQGRFDPVGWVRELERFGYRFGPPLKRSSKASLELPLRLGISAALTVNVMLFSVSFYFGLAPDEPTLFRLFSWLSAALSTAVVAVGGWPFLRAAVRGLRRGVLHLDLPIAVGILLVWATSLARMRGGRGDLAYFDTLDVFITLMLAGRLLQERVLERNRRFLLEDEGVEGLTARVISEGRPALVPAARVRAGDRLLVAPGDLVPVDAVLSGGRAELGLDWITGESRPVAVDDGARIPAGAVNAGRSAFHAWALADFADSSLVALLRQPAGGEARASRQRLLWDRVARAWVVGVGAIATLGVLLWLPAGAERALEIAAAILVVTCPCAIGLAVPLATELVTHQLRRAGFWIRDRDLLDRLPGVGKLVFDKTGTLTVGSLELERPGELLALPPEARDIAYNLAVRSGHPVARAVATTLAAGDVRYDERAEVREETGRGLELERADGLWRLGTADWAAPALAGSGTVLARDGVLVATLPTRERLRPDAARELAGFAAEGREVWLLSGDRPERVTALAARLGLPRERALGGLDPEAKALELERIGADDALFVGDGVNDALAFERARVAGTPAIDRPVMPGRSDFFLLGEGLAPLAAALDGARRLRRTVSRLLAAAVAYNLAAVVAALAGWVTPVTAAVAMPSSTLALIAITLWSLERRRAPRTARGEGRLPLAEVRS